VKAGALFLRSAGTELFELKVCSRQVHIAAYRYAETCGGHMFIAIARAEASPVVPELQLRHTLQLDTIR